jgi:hypothetical protein
MDYNIKKLIEEEFKSKKQQKYFYAKSQDKTLSEKERERWAKMAREFSKETNYKELTDEMAEMGFVGETDGENKDEKDLDEIVDENGNIKRGVFPADWKTKGGGYSKSTTDTVAKTGAGSMGTRGVHGTHTSLRYWAESDQSKSLGFDETIGEDATYDEAYKHFTETLKLTHDEAVERLGAMGYDEKLPEDKVRLVENTKKFISDYVETILTKKTNIDEIVPKTNNEDKKINPIILKQIESLKNSLKSNGLTINDIKKHL